LVAIAAHFLNPEGVRAGAGAREHKVSRAYAAVAGRTQARAHRAAQQRDVVHAFQAGIAVRHRYRDTAVSFVTRARQRASW
jgi:hypothetical protein